MVVVEELLGLDATGQAELVSRSEVSALELVEAAAGRLEAVNSTLNAVIHPDIDRARQHAGALLVGGAFRGVPFLVKDLIAHAAGEPFHEGVRALADAGFCEDRDTSLVQMFGAAGLVTVGRTNTSELGLLPTTEPLSYGPTRNPWDLSRSPLGSGGGSAAAVAAGVVPLAHSNDGGGSIRLPASACGLIGLKPTRGESAWVRISGTWCRARSPSSRSLGLSAIRARCWPPYRFHGLGTRMRRPVPRAFLRARCAQES